MMKKRIGFPIFILLILSLTLFVHLLFPSVSAAISIRQAGQNRGAEYTENFSSSRTEKYIYLDNDSNALVMWSLNTTKTQWLTIPYTQKSGQISPGIAQTLQFLFQVDRQGLAPGKYEDSIVFFLQFPNHEFPDCSVTINVKMDVLPTGPPEPPPPDNPNPNIKVSSTYNGFSADRIINGKPMYPDPPGNDYEHNFIFADADSNQSATIDLEENQTINQIRFCSSPWEPLRSPSRVVMDISIDNENWVNIVNAGQPADVWTVYKDFGQHQARWVRVNLGSANGFGDRICEIEVLFDNEPPPNNLPVVKNLNLSPLSPTTRNDLVLSYEYSDPDGDAENSTEIIWYSDGELQANFNDEKTVPSSATSIGQKWYCTVKPKDGQSSGELAESNIVEIIPTPPKGPATITKLTDNPGTDWQPDWHPDGNSIIYISAPKVISKRIDYARIHTIPVNGGSPEILYNHASSYGVRYSLDGSKILFSQKGGGKGLGIYSLQIGGAEVIPLPASSATMIYDTERHDYWASWSPDNTRIAFEAERGSHDFRLWVVSAGGWIALAGNNAAEELYDHCKRPVWSPDGSNILFASSETNNIMAIPSMGGTPTELTSNSWNETSPVYSPNGEWIAFCSNRNDKCGLWIMPANGGEQVLVVSYDIGTKIGEIGSLGNPAWSPDGTKIAFDMAEESNKYDIYIASDLPIPEVEPPPVGRTLSITSAEASPGDQATVRISISDATGIASGDMMIEYDAGLMSVDTVTATDLLSGMLLITNIEVPGEILLSLAGATGLPSGSGALVEITLTTNSDIEADIEATLKFSRAEIYDEQGTLIPANLENGIVRISPQRGIKGDVNNDGKIRSNDATLTLRIATQLTIPTEYQQWAADMNDDGVVKANDATIILRTAAGLTAPGKSIIANAGEHAKIAMTDVYGTAGETIAVPIKISDAGTIASGDISIAYDPSVLRIVDISSISQAIMVSNTNEPGIVRIAFAGTDGLNRELIAEIQFAVLADVISPLKFHNVELYKPNGIRLDSETLDGRFTPWSMPAEHTGLLQNFPNPFNPETWIPYQLKESTEVAIRIYGVTGELVRNLNLGNKSAGVYANTDRSAYWDGKNEVGEQVSSGIYFYTIQAGEFTATRKMVVAK